MFTRLLVKTLRVRTLPLRTWILSGFLVVLLVVGVATLMYGISFISSNIIGRTQREIARNLKAAWSVYNNELSRLEMLADFLARDWSADRQRTRRMTKYVMDSCGVDYVRYVPDDGKDGSSSRSVFSETRIISRQELEAIDPALARRAFIPHAAVPMERPSGEQGDIQDGLVMEATAHVRNPNGTAAGSIKVGILLNRNFDLVDRIRDMIFEARTFEGKPLGNVTIFRNDRRIATNVLTDNGERAIGTGVSERVYDRVIGRGLSYVDRAFVVNDWYLTAYDPIRNRDGAVVGILYVGRLERPFLYLRRQMMRNLIAMLAAALVLCGFISFRIALGISRPLKQVISASGRMASGDLSVQVEPLTTVTELDTLAGSFNRMADSLRRDREEILETNEKLNTANRNYLNMIGFVSHELKGVLGSVIMNVLSVKEGYLGPLTAKQQRALDSAGRSLEHFENMVRNYLDLSRIEKGELQIHPSQLDLAEEVIGLAVAHMEKESQQKGIRIETDVPQGLTVRADRNLLVVVCNNLLTNALKYGSSPGTIRIRACPENSSVRISFYNDGPPIPEDQKERLFQRFSRLPGSEKVKGTGLGLFICRQIVERHGGKMWAESCEGGNLFVLTIPKGETDVQRTPGNA